MDIKNSLFSLLFTVLSIDAAIAQRTHADSLAAQLHQPASKYVMVAAHRGDWRNAPENSLNGFKSAIAMGVDIIELDLNKTKDGVIVIIHDATIDRTTDGKGKPSDYTWKELQQFHLRNGLGRVTQNHIPTLIEVMQAAKGKVLVNLDKSYPYYPEAYAILKQTGTLKQVIFKAENTYEEVNTRYPNLLDSITYMAIVNLDKPNARQVIDRYQQYTHPIAFELNFKTDTSAVLRDTRFIVKNGSKVWINSLWPSLNAGHDDDLAVENGDTKNSWDWIILHGATIIQTDRPKELLQYLKRRRLHK